MGETALREQAPKASKDLNLFLLTWPIFLEITLFMLMGSADTLTLSYVSDDAVSAAGVANQFVLIAILILEVVANGAALVVAQYLGSRKPEEAARIAGIAITLNLGLGLAMSAAFLAFGNPLLRAANLQGDVLVYAQTYLGIVGGGIVLQALINTFSGLIRTYGYTRESMYVTLGMNVLNVVGNYALIFGHLGAPELGVAGAAISTVISRFIAAVVFLWLLYRVMEVRIRLRFYFEMTRGYLRNIMALGIPSALEQVTYHSCQSVFLYYITFLGAAELAARQYATNITMYIYLFGSAIGMGTAIIVGRLVGAGRKEGAYRRVWRSLLWGLAVTMLAAGAVVSFRASIVGWFTDDPAVVALASQVILISLLLEPGRCFNLVLVNALRAAGDAKVTVYIGFVSMAGMSLPLGYYLAFKAGLGLTGVFLAIAADEWVRGIYMYFRWRSRAWEGKALVGPPPPSVPPGPPSADLPATAAAN